MHIPATMLEIKTLGRFKISVAGKAVASDWPDETIKLLFCSLLSPLDLSFTWDRICRSMWGVPVTSTTRRQLEELLIQPLNKFLMMEFGFNTVMADAEGVSIDPQHMHIDAHEFYFTALEGLMLMFLDKRHAALEKIHMA